MLKILFRWGGWVGWLEDWGLKIASAKVEVEVGAELGNNKKYPLEYFEEGFSYEKF